MLGSSWRGRSYDLGRMSFAELWQAYWTYPAIRLYLVLGLLSAALAGWLAAGWLPSLGAAALRVVALAVRRMARQQVRVTFFAAQEKTREGDGTLGEHWAPWWRARAAEGHDDRLATLAEAARAAIAGAGSSDIAIGAAGRAGGAAGGHG